MFESIQKFCFNRFRTIKALFQKCIVSGEKYYFYCDFRCTSNSCARVVSFLSDVTEKACSTCT